MLGDRVSACRTQIHLAASDHANAYLCFPNIHGANLLVDKFIFNGALGVSIEFALGDVRGGTVIARRFRFLRQKRKSGREKTQDHYLQHDFSGLHFSSPLFDRWLAHIVRLSPGGYNEFANIVAGLRVEFNYHPLFMYA
jgi:hypothetical protein